MSEASSCIQKDDEQTLHIIELLEKEILELKEQLQNTDYFADQAELLKEIENREDLIGRFLSRRNS